MNKNCVFPIVMCLCLFCGWQSSMAEWVFEGTRKTELSPGKPVTENVYATTPKLSKDKSYVIIKKKYTHDDSEYVRITASQIFLSEKYDRSLYYKFYEPRYKRWVTKDYRNKPFDNHWLIVPDSDREKMINKELEKIGLPPILNKEKHTWEWIYADKSKNVYICTDSCYHYTDKKQGIVFIKLVSVRNLRETENARIVTVDFPEHRIQWNVYPLTWKGIPKESVEESIYEAAKKVIFRHHKYKDDTVGNIELAKFDEER